MSAPKPDKTIMALCFLMGLITASALAAAAINVNLLWYL
jgi:hypothetical protein